MSQDIGQFSKISSKEFQTILASPSNYLPSDLLTNGVIIQIYNTTEAIELERQACLNSFAHNGIDTTNYSTDVFKSSRSFWSKYVKLHEMGEPYIKRLTKKLTKKCKNITSAREQDFINLDKIEYRYIIKFKILTTKKSPDHVAYVSTGSNYFYDRHTGKEYEIFLPQNRSLMDLVKHNSQHQ